MSITRRTALQLIGGTIVAAPFVRRAKAEEGKVHVRAQRLRALAISRGPAADLGQRRPVLQATFYRWSRKSPDFEIVPNGRQT